MICYTLDILNLSMPEQKPEKLSPKKLREKARQEKAATRNQLSRRTMLKMLGGGIALFSMGGMAFFLHSRTQNAELRELLEGVLTPEEVVEVIANIEALNNHPLGENIKKLFPLEWYQNTLTQIAAGDYSVLDSFPPQMFDPDIKVTLSNTISSSSGAVSLVDEEQLVDAGLGLALGDDPSAAGTGSMAFQVLTHINIAINQPVFDPLPENIRGISEAILWVKEMSTFADAPWADRPLLSYVPDIYQRLFVEVQTAYFNREAVRLNFIWANNDPETLNEMKAGAGINTPASKRDRVKVPGFTINSDQSISLAMERVSDMMAYVPVIPAVASILENPEWAETNPLVTNPAWKTYIETLKRNGFLVKGSNGLYDWNAEMYNPKDEERLMTLLSVLVWDGIQSGVAQLAVKNVKINVES